MTKRPMVLLPAELHHKLKVYAAEQNIPVKELVADAIRKHLGIKEGEKK